MRGKGWHQLIVLEDEYLGLLRKQDEYSLVSSSEGGCATVVLTRIDIARALEYYLKTVLTGEQLAAWAELLQVNEAVKDEPGCKEQITQALALISARTISGPIGLDAAEDLRVKLNHNAGTGPAPDRHAVNRRGLLQMIALDGGYLNLLRDLSEYQCVASSADQEMTAVLTVKDLDRAMEFYCHGKLTAEQLRAWAEILEMNDDIDYEEGHEPQIAETLFLLSTPEINCPISLAVVEKLRAALSRV